MVGQKGVAEGGARGGFENDLPGEAAAGVFVEGGFGRRELEVRTDTEVGVGLTDFGEGGFFGLIGGGKFGEVGEGWEGLFLALTEEILSEGWVVGGEGGLDARVVGLESLDDHAGAVKMTAPDAADDLGK